MINDDRRRHILTFIDDVFFVFYVCVLFELWLHCPTISDVTAAVVLRFVCNCKLSEYVHKYGRYERVQK